MEIRGVLRYCDAMKRIVILAWLLAIPALADTAGPNGRVIDCYCTDTEGLRVALGESICLTVDGRAFMAQCDMSLNVPIWRDTGAGCLSSARPLNPTERVIHLLHPPV